jgi:hypothetical protein
MLQPPLDSVGKSDRSTVIEVLDLAIMSRAGGFNGTSARTTPRMLLKPIPPSF